MIKEKLREVKLFPMFLQIIFHMSQSKMELKMLSGVMGKPDCLYYLLLLSLKPTLLMSEKDLSISD